MPRHRTCQRWHDMAAGISIKREKQPIPLRVCGKVVFLQHQTNLTLDGTNESEVL